MRSHKADPHEKEYGMPKGKYFELLEDECNTEKEQLKEKNQFTNLQELLHVYERNCLNCGKVFYIEVNHGQGAATIRRYCYDCLPLRERMTYVADLDRQIVVNTKKPGPIRRGKCQMCRRAIGDTYINASGETSTVTSTRLHKINNVYVPDNPLQNTIELCESCHCAQQWQEGSIRGWKK